MTVVGRPCQDAFSAHAKCCGTAFGKKGSLLPLRHQPTSWPAQSPFRRAAHLPPNRAAEKPAHLFDDRYRLPGRGRDGPGA